MLRPRLFRGPEDWPGMAAIVNARQADHLHVVDLPYRLCSWAFDDPANCTLWEDAGGQIMAWAALQPPFWSIDYALHQDAPPGTLELALAWAEQRARAIEGTPFARPAWYISCFAGHPHGPRLEASGFRSQAEVGANAWTKVLLQRDAWPAPEQRPLPAGFRIRPLNEDAEVEAYVALHRAVFQSENMTLAWRHRILAHPAYLPHLDLVLVDAEEQLAGFCVGWLSPMGSRQEPTGQVEPMGIRADLRGRALGQALLAACLTRLAGVGAATVFVETDNYRDAAFKLYTAAGFQLARDVLVYRKDAVQDS